MTEVMLCRGGPLHGKAIAHDPGKGTVLRIFLGGGFTTYYVRMERGPDGQLCWALEHHDLHPTPRQP